jgi:hypothetical protein
MRHPAMTEAALPPPRRPLHTADPEASPCDEALISRQRQRYLVSLITENETEKEEEQSDSRYREQ